MWWENPVISQRMTELNNILTSNKFAINPCEQINKIASYGSMFQAVAQFTIAPTVLSRVQQWATTWNYPWGFFNVQDLTEANGKVVNCDFYPLQISQFPVDPQTGIRMDSKTLLEYFRLHINDFITPNNTGVSFSCQHGISNNNMSNDCSQWNYPFQQSLGSVISIHIPLDDGTVILSDYTYTSSATNPDIRYFNFSTMSSPFDMDHPVAGTRRFGIYNTTGAPDSYTFYILGVLIGLYDFTSSLFDNRCV